MPGPFDLNNGELSQENTGVQNEVPAIEGMTPPDQGAPQQVPPGRQLASMLAGGANPANASPQTQQPQQALPENPMLSNPNVVRGIPKDIFMNLDPSEQDGILKAPEGRILRMVMRLAENDSYKEAWAKKDIPKAMSIAKKYMETYRITSELPSNMEDNYALQ